MPNSPAQARPANPPVPAIPQGPGSTPAAQGGPGTFTPATDIAAMQNQLGDLRVQQAGLKAQWTALRRQLDNMLQSNPARPGVQQQWADVGVNLAKVEGDIASLQARIAQRQGLPVPGTQVPQFQNFRRNPDPDMVVGMSLLLLMLVATPLSIAFARRIWRGKPQPAAPRVDEIAPRLDRLEQAVDAIAIEVERISEGQRFVTKILAERPMQTPAATSAEASGPDSKAPLALGAGPMEPIRVGDRQGVRQSVTPH